MQLIIFALALICGIFFSKSTYANEAPDLNHVGCEAVNTLQDPTRRRFSYHFHFLVFVTSTCTNANTQHK